MVPGAALLAILLILVLTLAPAPADTQVAANVQPALLALAAEQPDTAVRVIIQKGDGTNDIAAVIDRLDGSIIDNLYIINAVVADLPAGSVTHLAQTNGVQWVSLDAPVEGAGKPAPASYTIADYFDAVSYFNNDGSAGWSTPWIEEDSAAVEKAIVLSRLI